MDAKPDGSCQYCGNELNHCDAGHCNKYIRYLEKDNTRLKKEVAALNKILADLQKEKESLRCLIDFDFTNKLRKEFGELQKENTRLKKEVIEAQAEQKRALWLSDKHEIKKEKERS